jgi:hypothetical protein
MRATGKLGQNSVALALKIFVNAGCGSVLTFDGHRFELNEGMIQFCSRLSLRDHGSSWFNLLEQRRLLAKKEILRRQGTAGMRGEGSESDQRFRSGLGSHKFLRSTG